MTACADLVITHALEWPSLTVQWLPVRSFCARLPQPPLYCLTGGWLCSSLFVTHTTVPTKPSARALHAQMLTAGPSGTLTHA